MYPVFKWLMNVDFALIRPLSQEANMLMHIYHVYLQIRKYIFWYQFWVSLIDSSLSFFLRLKHWQLEEQTVQMSEDLKLRYFVL